jgi:hypothetical protein
MGVLPDDVGFLFAIGDRPLDFGARKRRPWAEVGRVERNRNTPIAMRAEAGRTVES